VGVVCLRYPKHAIDPVPTIWASQNKLLRAFDIVDVLGVMSFVASPKEVFAAPRLALRILLLIAEVFCTMRAREQGGRGVGGREGGKEGGRKGGREKRVLQPGSANNVMLMLREFESEWARFLWLGYVFIVCVLM
jgi:hypothetical protein